MRRFIVCILMTVCIFGLAACGQPKSEDIRAMIVDKTYIYEKEGVGGSFTIHFNDDGTFLYHEGPLSSYLGIGVWELDDDTLILSDDEKIGYSFVNYFKVNGSDLVFLSENSSNFLYIKVADGERFTGSSDET